MPNPATPGAQARARERKPAQGEKLKEKCVGGKQTVRLHGDLSYILGCDACFSGVSRSEPTVGAASAEQQRDEVVPAPRFRGDERQHLFRVEIHWMIWSFLKEANMDRFNVSSGRGEDAHGTEQPGSFVATVADQTTHWTFVASAVTRWLPDQQADSEEKFLPNFP